MLKALRKTFAFGIFCQLYCVVMIYRHSSILIESNQAVFFPTFTVYICDISDDLTSDDFFLL